MAAESTDWTELREFEDVEPSALAFRALVALLDTWQGKDQAAAIEHAEQFLSCWPDEMRRAPWSWCKAASQGMVPASWRLVRSLQLTAGHLGKGSVHLGRLARHASLARITVLDLPPYSDYPEISFLYHRPDDLPALKKLTATDKYDDGEVRALADSPLWRKLESFAIDKLDESLFRSDASRIVPRFSKTVPILHLRLRAPDLIAAWKVNTLARLKSVAVFIRSIDEAKQLAKRPELARLKSLSLAFRCGSNGSSPFEPFLGNIIEADEAAAEAFFRVADLRQLDDLAIHVYSRGYWGREGLGHLGLETLIASGLLQRVKRLRLELLPLGDKGVAALAPALGKQLKQLELVNVYCKGTGAAALALSPCLPSLRHLDLSANRIDAEQCAKLASVKMPRLQYLDLSGPEINPYYWNIGQQPLLDAGAAAWANSGNAKRLKTLRLANCHLQDEALAAIFQSELCSSLVHLDLSHNAFSAAGVTQAVTNSPLWAQLQSLQLNHCRLDNAAIAGLTRVKHAPALRSLELGYNSIGPAGAMSLAHWPVLAQLWQLQLHDNVIGDEGLMALAGSRNVGRLLELDLEQDCWNSRAFTFNNQAAQALAASPHLRRLEAIFSGLVDEYHGACYSPGFTKKGLELVGHAAWARPALRAAVSDFSKIDAYYEPKAFKETAKLREEDFRGHPITLNEQEAKGSKSSMKQVRGNVKDNFDDRKPAKILDQLPDDEDPNDEEIAGISFRDPQPEVETFCHLTLSLEDKKRQLPQQAGKFLSDVLGSIFQATGAGTIEVGGGGSRIGDDGEDIPTHVTFYVGLASDPAPALQYMREALWWVGAPKSTGNKELPLALGKNPGAAASRWLQLATLSIHRWDLSGVPGHRIDRVTFTATQRRTVETLLTSAGAKLDDGWVHVSTEDGGDFSVYTRYLQKTDDFDALNVLVEQLSPEVSNWLHRLMIEGGFMLLPMAMAASENVAATLEGEWPSVTLVNTPKKLHSLLKRGPFARWNDE